MLSFLAPLLLALQQSKSPPPPPPRLVVMIAVDQLIPEQLQRLETRFSGGFERFLDEGAVFWRATVDYACTETGPGHATLATGRWPLHHGIVGNAYFDRAARATVYCVGDGESHPLTSAGLDATREGVSPANLIGDALGDILERSAPGSKTVTIAGKDRSAVLMGGRAPDAALWWSASAGGFASATAYGEKLPEFVEVWNRAWRERARGWKWTSELEGDLAALGTAPDEREGESKRGGRTLPRTLPSDDGALAGAVLSSPLVDYFTIELAILALDTEGLGRDESVDFLGLSLSGPDILGHGYGPDSVEVTDLLVRDDKELGRLFRALDEKVGKGRWLACLSSDHGVLDLPELLQSQQVGARRVKGADVAAMRKTVEEAIELTHPGHADLGLRFTELGFTFDPDSAMAAGIEPAALRDLIAEAAEEADWVADAYTLEELLASDAPGSADTDAWLTLYRRCACADRAPDVVLRPEPWLLFDFAEGTSHGSPYPYDRRVPLAFLGGRVKAQQRFDAASPTDAVPTLLALAGLQPPAGLDGRVLKVD
jgi:predicted AlkP superfamily pyrophosphatase or phosphodiesterase